MAEATAPDSPLRQRRLVGGYVMWLCFGLVGFHRIYLGAPLSGAAMLFLMIAAWVSAFVNLGPVPFILWLGWFALDGFLIPGMVRRANARLQGQAGA